MTRDPWPGVKRRPKLVIGSSAIFRDCMFDLKPREWTIGPFVYGTCKLPKYFLVRSTYAACRCPGGSTHGQGRDGLTGLRVLDTDTDTPSFPSRGPWIENPFLRLNFTFSTSQCRLFYVRQLACCGLRKPQNFFDRLADHIIRAHPASPSSFPLRQSFCVLMAT